VTWTVRRRYRHIARTLARHGLGYSLARAGLGALIPRGRGGEPAPRGAGPRHLRLALQELGPAFIKLGQVLSTRADLLPPEVVEELARLHAEIPPVPFARLLPVLEAELGPDFRKRFRELDETPLAAASIGQVHRARLLTGEEVAVKVQRPGVAEEVAVDLVILRRLARRAARTSLGRMVDLENLMEEFALTLERELDYLEEARHAERFRANLADEPGVVVPAVHWDLTTPRVLTLDLVSGARLDDPAALEALGVDRRALAARLARLYLKMIFEDGFFHADPHPGNFFVRRDGTIALVDFGLVGAFNEAGREQLVALLRALVQQDAEAMVDAILDLGAGLAAVERQALAADLQRLVTRYADRPLAAVSIETLLHDVLRLAYRHRLRLPANLSLLAKTLAMSEGLARRLDPRFRVMDVVVPYTRRMLIREYGPKGLRRRLPLLAAETADALPRLPATLFRVLRRAERGDLALALDPRQLAESLRLVAATGERLARAILAAALLTSTAILLAAYRDLPLFPVGLALRAGFLTALALALWWLRPRRPR